MGWNALSWMRYILSAMGCAWRDELVFPMGWDALNGIEWAWWEEMFVMGWNELVVIAMGWDTLRWNEMICGMKCLVWRHTEKVRVKLCAESGEGCPIFYLKLEGCCFSAGENSLDFFATGVPSYLLPDFDFAYFCRSLSLIFSRWGGDHRMRWGGGEA